MLGMPGAGAVVDLHARPPELVDAPVPPHPHRVVQGAMPLAVLLRDQHDRELLEAQRHVEPPEAETLVVRRPSRGLGLADGTDAPRTVAAAEPGVRVDAHLVP